MLRLEDELRRAHAQVERLQAELKREVQNVHKHYRRDLVLYREETAAGQETGMDFNKLTIKSQEAVAAAQELARRNGNPEIYPEHLLLALLDQELPVLVPDADALRAEAEAKLAAKPRIEGAQQQPQVGAQFSRVLDEAFDEAKRIEDDYVSTEHLLLALEPVPREEPRGVDHEGARRPARHLAGSRGHLPGAREVRPRPHRGGARRASSTR